MQDYKNVKFQMGLINLVEGQYNQRVCVYVCKDETYLLGAKWPDWAIF